MLQKVKNILLEKNIHVFTPPNPVKFIENEQRRWFEGITTYKNLKLVIVSSDVDKARIPLDNISEQLAVIIHHQLVATGKTRKVV